MEEIRHEDKERKRRTRTTWVLLVVIAFLLLVARPFFINPANYPLTSSYLDEKLANANMLALGTSSASFVVTMLPDDTGTPIAQELAKFSSYLLLVISAIFLERYLIATIGFISTTLALPAACISWIIYLYASPEQKIRFKQLTYRLAVFGICVIMIVPLGCLCGRSIEAANEQSIRAALNSATQANRIVQDIPDEKQSRNIFEKVGDFFAGLWNSATEAYEWAKTVLTNFMQSIAVMLVTTIAIPILILFGFLILIRFLTKKDVVKMAEVLMQQFVKKNTDRMVSANRWAKEKIMRRRGEDTDTYEDSSPTDF